jgi:acetyl esterase
VTAISTSTVRRALAGAAARAQGPVLRAVFALPDGAKRRLAGRPVVVDGVPLDTETQLLLRLRELAGDTPIEELPVPQARRALVAGSRLVGGKQPVGSVRDFTIPGPGGDVPVRHYVPTTGGSPAPTLVFLHGGGFVYGDLESHDALCRFLAERAGVRVLAVDYRLAPEHPFPAAVEDAYAAYAWAAEHADEIGADVDRLVVGGDSAGGNLAAVTALLARDSGVPDPAYQLLVYPTVDFSRRRRSRDLYGEGFFLSNRFMDQCSEAYVPDVADHEDPRVSPLLAPDLGGLPPAYVVTAGFDPLRDEGQAYADALREAGVEVTYACERGLIHSFANTLVIGRSGREAMTRAAAALREAVAR